MEPFTDFDFDQHIKELMEIIEENEFRDMETAYITSLKKLKTNLSDMQNGHLTTYMEHLENHILKLKSEIIERFSPYNSHLTEEYLDELIQTDRILFAQLDKTSKREDCLQYLRAKEQYSSEYKELLLSLPEFNALTIDLQNKFWKLSMHIAELNFLLEQPLIIRIR